jgi:FkbM family methyltransferase
MRAAERSNNQRCRRLGESDIDTHMRTLIRKVREVLHPLHYARKSPIGRFAIRLADRPIWISEQGVNFKVRGRLITHGLAFAIIGSQERNPEALAKACMRTLQLRSFWDVGANIGHYSWLMKTTKTDLKLVLIEPLPENATLIRSTLARNRFPNATLLVAGASQHSGTGTLHTDRIAGATSSLEEQKQTFEERHFGVHSATLQIPLIAIDEARNVHGQVDFMKIDVEGHEESALRGAMRTIREDQPILFIECTHPGHVCLAPLESEGYCVVDADHLSRECTKSSANYFCFPKRFADSVEMLLQLARQESA